jgi:dimethylargininase
VPTSEPWGANTLPIGDRVMVAGAAPQTADLLRQRGIAVHPVDISELQKAEAGLTCLSVIYCVSFGGARNRSTAAASQD